MEINALQNLITGILPATETVITSTQQRQWSTVMDIAGIKNNLLKTVSCKQSLAMENAECSQIKNSVSKPVGKPAMELAWKIGFLVPRETHAIVKKSGVMERQNVRMVRMKLIVIFVHPSGIVTSLLKSIIQKAMGQGKIFLNDSQF